MKNLFASSLHFIINVYNPHNILTVHYVIGHKHIKLPLVFKDVGLFRAFSTDTNELSIPTRCVLCLLMVHQISLYYRTIVTIITTVNLLIVTITRSVQCFVPNQTLLTLRCLATAIAYPSLSRVFIMHTLHVAFQVGKLNILLHSPHWTFTIFPISF